MGRHTDQDVHAAFVEFRAKEDDKCLSVQCIYCQQVRAKNTSRQKAHLLECPGLQNHPSAVAHGGGGGGGLRPTSSSSVTEPDQSMHQYEHNHTINNDPSNHSSNHNVMQNGTPARAISNTPFASHSRPSLPPHTGHAIGMNSSNAGMDMMHTPNKPGPKPKPKTTTPSNNGMNIPAPNLEDVHAAFVEFRAKEDDKCLSVQCVYCQQVRAKNTSRQRMHLLECPAYLNAIKDTIPANNLLHRFDENEIARSIQLPTPTLELDFRMSVKLNPKVLIGTTASGQQNWISFIGGQWAGRWGKGIVIPGGQDLHTVQKDHTTMLNSRFLIQTADEPPAFISVKTSGVWTGPKDTMERIWVDAEEADRTTASAYKFRVNLELECGDERYAFLQSGMWLGSGARRAGEMIIDAYRIG